MKMYYVIATRDHATNKLYYHTGKYTPYGNIYLGDVLEAKKFNSWNDLIGFLKTDYNHYMGFSVIQIADVTFKKLQESYEGDKDLYRKYHDPNYAIR